MLFEGAIRFLERAEAGFKIDDPAEANETINNNIQRTQDILHELNMALELTNGPTLTALLQGGASKLVEGETSGKALIEALYEKAVGRAPTPQELELAQSVVGEKPKKEGVEDFLWAIVMLPEFQLIR